MSALRSLGASLRAPSRLEETLRPLDDHHVQLQLVCSRDPLVQDA